MNRTNWLWALCASILVAGCSSGTDTTTPNTPSPTPTNTTPSTSPTATVAFSDVQGIFSAHCTGCHGENGKKGINLTSYDSIMKGGEEGPIVTAGDPDKSKIIDALRGRNGAKQMPMNQQPLAEEDIKKIEDWIKAGAKA